MITLLRAAGAAAMQGASRRTGSALARALDRIVSPGNLFPSFMWRGSGGTGAVITSGQTDPGGGAGASSAEDDSITAVARCEMGLVPAPYASGSPVEIEFAVKKDLTATHFADFRLEYTGGATHRLALRPDTGQFAVNAGTWEGIEITDAGTWWLVRLRHAGEVGPTSVRFSMYPALGFTSEFPTQNVTATGTTVVYGAKVSDPRLTDLATQIVGMFAAANFPARFVGLIRGESDVSLADGKVETLLDRSGGDKHATQATGTARPTYSATAINGLPGITLDGGDYLVTPDIDLSGATAAVLMILMSDADTAGKIPVEWGTTGSVSTAGGIAIITNDGGAGGLSAYGRRNSAASSARSAASYPMTSPAVVTATWDLALASDETEIRHGGVNVTLTRPGSGNNTGTLGSAKLSIGARDGGTSGMTGAIGAVILAAGETAIPVSTVAYVEAMLAASKTWSPTNDPLALLWWDPTDVVGAVAAWVDRISGVSAVQAVATCQPIASATAIGGAYPGVTGDGSDDALAAAGAGAVLDGLAQLTLVAAMVDTGTDTYVPLEYGPNAQGTTGSVGVFRNLGTRINAVASGGAFRTQRRCAESLDAVKVVSIGYDLSQAGEGAVTFIRVNGIAQSLATDNTFSTAGTLANRSLHLFARTATTLHWPGTFGHIVFRGSVDQDEVLVQHERFVGAQAGITLTG